MLASRPPMTPLMCTVRQKLARMAKGCWTHMEEYFKVEEAAPRVVSTTSVTTWLLLLLRTADWLQCVQT